jgi:hypothetical protein
MAGAQFRCTRLVFADHQSTRTVHGSFGCQVFSCHTSQIAKQILLPEKFTSFHLQDTSRWSSFDALCLSGEIVITNSEGEIFLELAN